MSVCPVALDAPCGAHFTFRDFVECGSTWERLVAEAHASGGETPDNIPKQVATYDAMRRLCAEVLDPVVGAFGSIELTYGFASPALTRHIKGRIAPQLDQHAGHELRRSGKPVCERLGMAADFLVEGQDMRVVARWIAAETMFDRLYFYDRDRPLHVSVGPQQSRQIVHVRRLANGRVLPRVLTPGSL